MKRALIARQSHMRMMGLANTMQIRMYHSVGRSGVEATQGETPITVYSSPDSEGVLSRESSNIGEWDAYMMSSPLKNKYFSLIPFQIESVSRYLFFLTFNFLQRFRQKHFVLKMELFPESKFLKFYSLRLDGIAQTYLPIKDLIPITKYDYFAASKTVFFKQNTCLDLDMIYANDITKEMYLFDKAGEWHDEGVYHKALDMDSTFNEEKWYDGFNVARF